MTGPSLEVANAHSQILEDAAHKIIDLSEGHITSLSEEILEAKSLVDEHRAAITSRKEKIVEIASIVPLAERKLEKICSNGQSIARQSPRLKFDRKKFNQEWTKFLLSRKL